MYRFVAQSTVEEKMMQRASEKMALDQVIYPFFEFLSSSFSRCFKAKQKN